MSIVFDESYYLNSKVNQLTHGSSGATWTVESLEQKLKEVGLTPYQHYELYGAYEIGVNPNVNFDDEIYCSDKAVQLNLMAYEGKNTWGVDDVEKILKDVGLSPLDHLTRYGESEGLSAKQSQTTTLAETNPEGKTIVGALYSGNATWNDLLSSNQSVIYYGFMQSKYDTKDGTWSDLSNFASMDATQRASVRDAFTEVSRVTGITFYETAATFSANILLGTGELGSNIAGTAYYPYYNSALGHLASSVIIDNTSYHSLDPSSDTAWYEVLLHEEGHAMSLKHPFEGSVKLSTSEDNTGNTLMSYTDSSSGPFNTYRPYDVLALQYIYGQDGIGGMGMSTWA